MVFILSQQIERKQKNKFRSEFRAFRMLHYDVIRMALRDKEKAYDFRVNKGKLRLILRYLAIEKRF